MKTLSMNQDSNMESQNINQQQKQTKGGFKMKPTRFLIVAIVLLGMVATASAITRSGTTITNMATGTYNDASGVAMDAVASNEVTTTVSQVAYASFGTTLDKAMSTMASTVYSVAFQNNGNDFDNFTIAASDAATAGSSFTYEIYHDLNGNGTLEQAEIDDGIVDTTGSIDIDEYYRLVVRVTDTFSGGSPAASEHTLTITGASAYNLSQDAGAPVDATIILTTTIQAASIDAVITVDDPTPQPGDAVEYSVCLTNDGTATAYGLVYTTVIPAGVTLDLNSVYVGATQIPSGSVDYDTQSRVLTVPIGDMLTTDPQLCVTYSVVVPTDALADLDLTPDTPQITFDNEDDVPYPADVPTDNTGGPSVAQTYGVTVEHTGAASTSFTGEAAIDTIKYPFTITNDGNGNDNFNFSSPVTDADLTDTDFTTVWVFYIDTNGDGLLSGTEDNTPVASLNTGTLAADASISYIAVATIVGGTIDQANDNLTFTATSANDPATDSATGAITCLAPVIVSETGLLKAVSPSGDQPPGTTLTYTLTVTNSGHADARTVVITDHIPADVTYQTGTVEINNVTKTDGSDADEVVATTTGGVNSKGVVTITFGTVAVSDPQVITFDVVID